MADTDAQNKDKAEQQQQPKGGEGGDHIPVTNEEEDEEPKQQGGLLSKIGDPVGMKCSPFPFCPHHSPPSFYHLNFPPNLPTPKLFTSTNHFKATS